MISVPNIKKLGCFHYIDFKLRTYLAHCNCVKFRPDQILGCTRPLYRPAGIRAFAMWNKALSCQHSTLYRLQNTIGLVGSSSSSLFVSVKALSVYGKYCTTALSHRATIRLATSAFIGMKARKNLHANCVDRQGKERAKRKGLVGFESYLTVIQIISSSRLLSIEYRLYTKQEANVQLCQGVYFCFRVVCMLHEFVSINSQKSLLFENQAFI